MEHVYKDNVFPKPPSSKPTPSKRNSGATDISHKTSDRRSLTPRPPNIARSKSRGGTDTNDVATQRDIQRMCEYIMILRQDLEAEQRKREADARDFQMQIQQAYNDSKVMRKQDCSQVAMLQSAVDSLRHCPNHIEKLQGKVHVLDTVLSRARLQMRDIANDLQALRLRMRSNVMPYGLQDDAMWSAYIIFVLNSRRPNCFEVGGIPYLKLQHCRKSQNVSFSDDTSLSFIIGIDGTFQDLLKGRAWMPLACHRDVNERGNRIALDRLTAKNRNSDCWTRGFLEEHCITYDMSGGAHIYIALQDGTLDLSEIRSLINMQPASVAGSATPRSNIFSPAGSTITSQKPSVELSRRLVGESDIPSVPRIRANHAVSRIPPRQERPINTILSPTLSEQTSFTELRPESPGIVLPVGEFKRSFYTPPTVLKAENSTPSKTSRWRAWTMGGKRPTREAQGHAVDHDFRVERNKDNEWHRRTEKLGMPGLKTSGKRLWQQSTR